MQRLRQIAFVILFAGWMLPALLAQNARERAVSAGQEPVPRGQVQGLAGVQPPPEAAGRVVTLLRTIAGFWFLIALVYASVLTLRFRRTLIS